MYLKFIGEKGQVIRYNEVKKRIILGMAREFQNFSKTKCKIKVNKSTADITTDIELLHNILITDFKDNYFSFQSVFNTASFYVAIPPQKSNNILILFGDLFLDVRTRKFYSVPIINGIVLLQNAIPVETPFYYKF